MENYISPRSMQILAFIGLLFLLRKLLRILKFFYSLIRPKLDLPRRYGEGSWVAVTGCTDGIGKAIGIEFAKLGFNIAQISRSKQKLQRCGEQLKRFGVKTKEIVCDFSRGSEIQIYREIQKQLQDVDLSVLVNNVGVDVLGKFKDLSQVQIKKVLDVNVYPATFMTKAFISKLARRPHKSAIVFVSSLAGQIPLCMHNVYSASKAFTDFMGRSLSYQQQNIDFISINPSEVTTPMTFNKKDFFSISSSDCAQGILKVLGRQRSSNGHWFHQLQGLLYKSVPESLYNFIFRQLIAPQFIAKRK